MIFNKSKFSGAAWLGHSIRHQVLIAMSLMLLVASIVAGTIAVINGRNAVNVEIEASMDFAEGYLRELVRRIAAEDHLKDIDVLVSREVQHLRHARVYIQDPGQPLRPLLSPSAENAEEPLSAVPDWFERLMMPAGGEEHARLILIPQRQTALVLRGDPDDEIAEKWQELASLAVVAGVSIALLLAAFYFVLGWILVPLVALARGLVALEAGSRSQRLDIPRVGEVADIARKFNSLAASLDQTRSENGELYRQIQSVQEDERREIARELHDEAGPCLFGITANVESISTLANGLEKKDAERIQNRTKEILEITDRMKAMNRALLKQLHPVSIGKVPLSALIKDLVFDFERRHPDIKFTASIGPLVGAYGEKIDLTVYRSTQEALTNAVRHGDATSITVELWERRDDRSAPDATVDDVTIQLRVSDDGKGLKPGAEAGFGLSAMRERVLSAAGSLVIAGNKSGGTSISVRLPARPIELTRSSAIELTRTNP
ncbi:sensor histidine kinase [Hyphomicrobium methylovorum]|uniref:histidine kinase n=1 Tax=Hyphomicrobium methylovorum TaxID=84 RepID=UPI0015E676D9|nr:ATP-binding protein [Hyphomicrobium methylovorum]MBA2125298.1 sensor histidine kinase [Hyphomicrobium methylovorum]